ncbi:hypothetical protein D3C87_578060 [compost metagenome]
MVDDRAVRAVGRTARPSAAALAPRAHRRPGRSAGDRAPPVRQARAGRHYQRLWSYRKHHLYVLLSDRPRLASRAPDPDRPPRGRHRCARARRPRPTVTGRRDRRTVRGRRGRGAGLLERSGPDGGEIRARPPQRPPALSNGRPGALAARRRAAIPGACRPASQDPGLPDRAWRDRTLPAGSRGRPRSLRRDTRRTRSGRLF